MKILKKALTYIFVKKELFFQNQEKRATELIIANKELVYQNQEKEKLTKQLMDVTSELDRAEKHQKEYIHGLEKLMFMTSHKVRQPVTNILGLSLLIDHSTNSPEEIKEYLEYIKQSAINLDTFTIELTVFIHNLKQNKKLITREKI